MVRPLSIVSIVSIMSLVPFSNAERSRTRWGLHLSSFLCSPFEPFSAHNLPRGHTHFPFPSSHQQVWQPYHPRYYYCQNYPKNFPLNSNQRYVAHDRYSILRDIQLVCLFLADLVCIIPLLLLRPSPSLSTTSSAHRICLLSSGSTSRAESSPDLKRKVG